jgi:hypothetical protein
MQQQTEEVKLFPTRGCFKTRVAFKVPVPVYEKICQATRIYGKCGLLTATLTQIFLYGYDFVQRSYGLDSLIAEVYKKRRSKKKQYEKEGLGELACY